MNGTSVTALAERKLVFRARGAAATLIFDARNPEIILSGPAGTGKSRACLEYLHKTLLEHRGARALILRKTLTSLVGSGIVTYREKVLDPLDGVTFFGGSRQEPASFRYPNGSRLVVGGLDKASKILSSEYDLIYVQEATELTEPEWETLTTRLRNGILPNQQLVGDCNPDVPTHWIKQRSARGQLRLLESRHADNPAVTDDYLARLDALTGVRRKRYRDGIWAAAEGMVYDEYDPAVHLIDHFDIPPEWPRSLSIDFGYTNPFVCQWWAEDPDGRLYRYRELYMTHRLVEDHAKVINERSEGERITLVVCDHDAEGRATLERHLKLNGGRSIQTTAAYKAISDGIQAVQSRLKPAGDGKPRLFFLRDSLIERDSELDEKKLPACTEEEIEAYVWDTRNNRKKGEIPVDEDNHGMDAKRYRVAASDCKPRNVARFV